MRTHRILIAFALFGLVAQPVAASDSGAANPVRDTVMSQQVWTQADAGAGDSLANRLEASYQWNKVGAVQPATQLLPDEPTGRSQAMVHIALAVLMIVLVAFGFTIAITSLRADIKQRRVVYHRRVRA